MRCVSRHRRPPPAGNGLPGLSIRRSLPWLPGRPPGAAAACPLNAVTLALLHVLPQLWTAPAHSLQFCGHAEVQRYLEAFAVEFDLLRHVRLGTEVRWVARSKSSSYTGTNGSSSSNTVGVPSEWPRWEVTIATSMQQQQQPDEAASTSTHVYDAVVVANGHYSRTRLPEIPGQAVFPGEIMHSHNYRTPERFRWEKKRAGIRVRFTHFSTSLHGLHSAFLAIAAPMKCPVRPSGFGFPAASRHLQRPARAASGRFQQRRGHCGGDCECWG